MPAVTAFCKAEAAKEETTPKFKNLSSLWQFAWLGTPTKVVNRFEFELTRLLLAGGGNDDDDDVNFLLVAAVGEFIPPPVALFCLGPNNTVGRVEGTFSRTAKDEMLPKFNIKLLWGSE